MARLNRDLHISAEFITFLKAGFYGQVLFEAALARLEPSVSPLPSSYLETAHKAFDKIDRWTKDLAEELPLFALNWKTIETFDAISAMSFLREFKRECLWIMPQIDSALSATNLAQNRDAVKLLAASLGLSRMHRDDLAQLEAGTALYDAFYRWARDATEETHNWPAGRPA